jgi:phosphoribosylanthranilate isomerase
MTRLKVCGITRAQDAELAVEAGAWAVGFILWPGSRRYVEPAMAAGIARSLRRRVELAGVFVNPTLDEVAHAADLMGLTHLQLHGDEGPSFCAAAAQRTGARVIKAVRVRSRADVADAERFHTDLHLLDGPGNGRTWDWSLAAARRSRAPLVVAGGLTAENVGEAITTARPWAVDVASGVEAAPGVKDPAKVRAFAAAVAAASEPVPTSAAASEAMASAGETGSAQREAE